MKQVTVTVPATTANLGPGFDCLGLALGLYNQITFTAETAQETHGKFTLTINGEGIDRLPTDHGNLVVRAAECIFERVGQRPPSLHIHQQNNIPVGSGLGSSAATVVGGMLAANALVDTHLSDADLLHLAIQMEGHPDNVAPALYGGLTLVIQENRQLHVEQIDTPPLRVVVVLPDFDLPTLSARAVLPPQVPFADAVFNSARLGLLLQALATADYSKLQLAMQDRLHQPYRLRLIPGAAAAFAAAYSAGAAGVALSGAGPSVIAFAADNHEAIGQAMASAFAAAGLMSRTWILPTDFRGSRLKMNG